MPFAGELLIAGYSLAFVPLGFAVHFAMVREWAYSAALALSWLALFPFVAMAFHRRGLIHIAVSVFAAVTLVGAGALFLWLASEDHV
jgi:hypothetical protein